MKKQSVDIKIKEVSYRKQHKFVSSRLELEMSGADMNYVVANTLRRVSYDDIPTYAFEVVEFTDNNMKAYDSDYMRLRLRQLPIYNMPNDLYYLHPKYWQGVDYTDKKRERPPEEKRIEGVINVYNSTNELLSVTTRDLQYYVDGVKTPYPDPYPEEPILLAELLPTQTLKCRMEASLGVGERDTIWTGSKLAYYDAVDDKIMFTIEGMGQISEYDTLVKCCRLVKLKLDSISEEIQTRKKSKEIVDARVIFFELVNEDHTMGNLINHALQNHKHILFAGVKKPDHLVRQIVFKMACTDDVPSPLGPLFEVLEYLGGVFSELEKQFEALSKSNKKSK